MAWCWLGDVGWELGQVGLRVVGTTRGGYTLQYGVYDRVRAPLDGEHPDAVSCRGSGRSHLGIASGVHVGRRGGRCGRGNLGRLGPGWPPPSRLAARTGWLVVEVLRRSTAWGPSTALRRCRTAGRLWREKVGRALASAAAGAEVCGERSGVGGANCCCCCLQIQVMGCSLVVVGELGRGRMRW